MAVFRGFLAEKAPHLSLLGRIQSTTWQSKPVPFPHPSQGSLEHSQKKPGSIEPGWEPGQSPVRDGTAILLPELANLVFVVDPQTPIRKGHDATCQQAAGQHESQPEPEQKKLIYHRRFHHNLLTQCGIAAVTGGGRVKRPQKHYRGFRDGLPEAQERAHAVKRMITGP